MRRAVTEALESRRYCYGLNSNSTIPSGDIYEGDAVPFELHWDVNPSVPFEAKIYGPSPSGMIFGSNLWPDTEIILDATPHLVDNGTITGELWIETYGPLYMLESTDSWEVLNVAPTASLNAASTINQGGTLSLSLTSPYDPSSVDTDAGFTYRFALDPGDLGTGGSSSDSDTLAMNTAGVVTVYARISDKDGGYTDYTHDVTVAAYTPSVTIAPYGGTVTEGSSISLTSTLTDPYHSFGAMTYAWVVERNTTPIATITAANPNYTFADNGTYVFRLSVTNSDSATGVATPRTYTVTNVAPTAIFRRLDGAVTTSGTDNVTFTLSAPIDPSSADTTAGFTYAFDLNDGDFADTGETPGGSATKTAHWNTEGNNYVYTRIYDKDGGYSQYRLTIYVNDLSNDYAGLAVGSDGVVITGAEASDAWVWNGSSYVYDPARWNRNPTANKCYNYAMNAALGFAGQPGVYGEYGEEVIQQDLDESSIETILRLIAAVQADSDANQGMSEPAPIIYIDPNTYTDTVDWAENTANYNEYYITALFLDPWTYNEDEFGQRDYHWYRHDADGNWSHKSGDAPASNKDFSNAVITDPLTANRYNGTYDYSIFVGYFAVRTTAADPIILA